VFPSLPRVPRVGPHWLRRSEEIEMKRLGTIVAVLFVSRALPSQARAAR
jgi:hypothetical protein